MHKNIAYHDSIEYHWFKYKLWDTETNELTIIDYDKIFSSEHFQ